MGEVLRYKGTQVAAFYVAGAVPSTANCVAKAGDAFIFDGRAFFR